MPIGCFHCGKLAPGYSHEPRPRMCYSCATEIMKVYKNPNCVVKHVIGPDTANWSAIYCFDKDCGVPFLVKNPGHPDNVIKKAIQAGWKAKLNDRRQCLCPKHAYPRKCDEMPLKLLPPATEPKSQQQSADQIRTPSISQRGAIRDLLDKHFEVKPGTEFGHYLDGKSDAALAEQLNVPRKWVEDIRETSYGPVAKDDPVITDLRMQLDGVSKRHEAFEFELMAKSDETRKAISALEARLNSHLAARKT